MFCGGVETQAGSAMSFPRRAAAAALQAGQASAGAIPVRAWEPLVAVEADLTCCDETIESKGGNKHPEERKSQTGSHAFEAHSAAAARPPPDSVTAAVVR
jgi:hypothetical protein